MPNNRLLPSLRLWGGLLLLNVALTLSVQAFAPTQPLYSDRISYERVGKHGLAPNCYPAIFCHRLVVPVLLEAIPVPADTRWKTYATLSRIAAGVATAALVLRAGMSPQGAILASIMAQTSFGFAYTAYDPYGADPAVLVVTALLALAWLSDRPRVAFVLGLAGIFVKQSIALVSASTGIAALLHRRAPTTPAWLIQAIVTCATLATFIFGMRLWAGWDYSTSDSANLLGGGWLFLWLRSGDLPIIALHLFAPFAFAWLYAALGYRHSPPRLRHLAIGAILPMLALVYVQTPERALSLAFYVVVPLATAYLLRVPFPLALLAAVTNGLISMKVGLSTPLLPPSPILIALAGLVMSAVIWTRRRRQAPDHAIPTIDLPVPDPVPTSPPANRPLEARSRGG